MAYSTGGFVGFGLWGGVVGLGIGFGVPVGVGVGQVYPSSATQLLPGGCDGLVVGGGVEHGNIPHGRKCTYL
jgi:hypothetical protein